MIQQQSYSFKIVLSGQSAVGKSSILCRYCDDTFEQNYLPTIGVDFRFKRVQIDDHICKLQIWDTAGQQKFKAITRTYYKNADAVIIVYDKTNPLSFRQIQYHWANQAKQNTNQSCLIYMAGNKCDLLTRTNSDITGSYAMDMGFRSDSSISAKSGEGINELFEKVCRQLLDKKLLIQNANNLGKNYFKQVRIEGDAENRHNNKLCGNC